MRTPSLVVHCDWSTSPTKRWMATATWEDRRYRLAAPPQVGSADALLRSLLQTRPSPVLIGFDFPIGLPLRYGDMTGFDNFRHCLREFGGVTGPSGSMWSMTDATSRSTGRSIRRGQEDVCRNTSSRLWVRPTSMIYVGFASCRLRHTVPAVPCSGPWAATRWGKLRSLVGVSSLCLHSRRPKRRSGPSMALWPSFWTDHNS